VTVSFFYGVMLKRAHDDFKKMHENSNLSFQNRNDRDVRGTTNINFFIYCLKSLREQIIYDLEHAFYNEPIERPDNFRISLFLKIVHF